MLDVYKRQLISLKGCLDEPSIVPPFVRIPEKSFDVSIL